LTQIEELAVGFLKEELPTELPVSRTSSRSVWTFCQSYLANVEFLVFLGPWLRSRGLTSLDVVGWLRVTEDITTSDVTGLLFGSEP